LVFAAAIVAAAGAASAQSVEFRIIERTNQTIVNSTDSLLELAVQAKVTGGNLGAFSFDIIANGELDSYGTLTKARISNTNGTYSTVTPWASNSTVGQGGMAAAYTYLASPAGTNVAALNGSINTSSGTFTNTPGSQEIGLITGRLMGSPLIGVPGMDPNLEGSPATWTGYGTGATPSQGTLAPLDPALAGPYFAGGQFIDIYRFRYSVSNLTTPRTLTFSLRNILAENFTRFVSNGLIWGAQDATVPAGSISGAPLSATVTGFSLVIPGPGSAALLGLGGLVVCRRRRS
jgi:hypothetical protein